MTAVEITRSGDTFEIDLNSVRDGNRAVAIVGFRRAQAVPRAGETVSAVDEDGNVYDAIVEGVLPDHRIYLKLKWATRRSSGRDYPLPFSEPRWKLAAAPESVAH